MLYLTVRYSSSAFLYLTVRYSSSAFALLILYFGVLLGFLEVAQSAEITLVTGEVNLCEHTNPQPGETPEPKCKKLSKKQQRGVVREDGGFILATKKETQINFKCTELSSVNSIGIPLQVSKRIDVKSDMCLCVPTRTKKCVGPGIGSHRLNRKELELSDFPSVARPRYTLLLNNKPTFYWTTLKKVNPEHSVQYSVTLFSLERGQLKEVWTVLYTGSGESIEKFSYPETNSLHQKIPGLKPQISYKLIVLADHSNSSDLFKEDKSDMEYKLNEDWFYSVSRDQFPVFGLTFELMNEKTKGVVSQEIRNSVAGCDDLSTCGLDLQKLDIDKNAFKLAEIYRRYYLYEEAIDALEVPDSKHGRASQQINIYISLSELYHIVGLHSLSVEALNRASTAAFRINLKQSPELPLADALKNLRSDLRDINQKCDELSRDFLERYQCSDGYTKIRDSLQNECRKITQGITQN